MKRNAPHPASLRIAGFEGKTAPDWLLRDISEGRLGGVILFARNLGAPEEVGALIAEIAQATPPGPPLIVSVDQEGGRVQRLKAPLTVWPPMLRLAKHEDLALTEAVGRALGEELRLLGFNVDWAPICDVHTNPANPIIGDRAFGETPEQAARQAVAFLRGLESAGMRGCAKHFPGHGDTTQDSHLELPRLAHPIERLRAVELPPFRAAMAAGVGLVMTAHVVMEALDARPATMAPAAMDALLRGELGFRGVVVSDDLDMQAVAAHYTVDEVVRGALAAGVDAFLVCRDPARREQAGDALVRAAADAALGSRVEASLARMHALRSTLSQPVPADVETLRRALPNADHQNLAARI